MMKYLLVPLLCLSFSASALNVDSIDIRAGMVYQENTDMWITGTYNQKRSNGKLKKKVNYRNGLKSGLSTKYYSRGKVETEYSYKDGNKSGEYRAFFKNGYAEEIGYYRGDIKHGEFTQYSKKSSDLKVS